MPTEQRRNATVRFSRWREIGVRLGLAMAALLVGGLALEGLTRAVFDRNGMHFGIEMWKYATEVKQRSSVAAMSHEHAPNRETLLMGVSVRTNSLGLRDREFSRQKPTGVHRILVLGDSMTFGWGAKEEDTYPKVLERLLNRNGRRYEVINAGVGNYNSAQEVAYFRERGILLQPDEVILGFYINDAEPTPAPSQSVLARYSYAYVVGSTLWDALSRRAGIKPPLTSYYDELYNEESTGWQACRKALIELSQLCRRAGIKLSMTLIPELHAPNERYPFRRVHALVTEVARKENVRAIDLLPAFSGIDPRSLWVSPGDAHANARGHEIMARTIYDAIVGDDEHAGLNGNREQSPEERHE